MVDFKERRLSDISGTMDYWVLTKSDSPQSVWYVRGIYIWGDGDLHVKNKKGETVIFYGVTAWMFVPVVTNTILTATTATNMVRYK
jgi:hypothetical protein